jgi:molecular chaperone DnaK (HSP70)
MFKYISEILAQFSTSQKIIALCLLLLSITIITLAPILIKSDKELKNEIEIKNKKISDLEIDLYEKHSRIREEQKKCTNEILKREKEFIDMLDRLRDRAKRDGDLITNTINKESHYMILDSTVAYSPAPPRTIIIKGDMNGMINEIDEMKRKIKK